jgi:hypothetical protein
MLFIMRSRWIKLLPNRIFLVTNSITMYYFLMSTYTSVPQSTWPDANGSS